MARSADPKKYKAILDVAADLFLRCGYAATSIEAVAKSAGVSKGTIYNRFETKDRLFRESITCVSSQLQAELLWDQGANSLRDTLINFGLALNTFLNGPKLIQFQRRLGADLEDQPQIGEAFLDAGTRHVHAQLIELLTAAEKEGRISFPSATDAAEQLISMCRGLEDLESHFGRMPAKEETLGRVEAAVDLFLSVYNRS